MKMNYWLILGFFAQFCFFMRFFTQWIYSEKKKKSVIPVYFWYLSLTGGSLLLLYAIHKKDPVFIMGQGMGLIVYIRNIILINRHRETMADE